MAFNPKPSNRILNSENTPASKPEISYFHGFLRVEDRRNMLRELLEELELQTETLVLAGKNHETRRLVDFRSDPSVEYRYSGANHHGKSWTPTLARIKLLVEEATAHKYNACLCNLYPDGRTGMGWHSDDEKELGANPTIASISLGEARTFQFRHKPGTHNLDKPPKWSYELIDGDLIVMRGKTQELFQHQIPVRKKSAQRRLNLTFRQINTSGFKQ